MLDRVKQNYINEEHAANLSDERLEEPGIGVLSPTPDGLYIVVVDGTHRMHERLVRMKTNVMPMRYIAADLVDPAMIISWKVVGDAA